MTMTTETEDRNIADIEAELENGLDNDIGGKINDPIVDPIEAEATRKGWVPKEEFSGDPSKWVDAKTFVDRGNKFNANLQREVERLRKQIESFEGTKQAFIKFTEERLAAKDAELKEAISQLRIQRSQAVREGEDELAVELEDRIDALKQQQKEVKEIPVEQKQTGPNMDDPVLNDWIEDGNEWFRDDAKLRDYAVNLGNELIANGEKLRGRKFLDRVAEVMAEEFPRRFGRGKTSSGGRVDPVAGESRGGGSSKGGKTEADLPRADRELMRSLVSEGYTTKEEFLKSYFSRK